MSEATEPIRWSLTKTAAWLNAPDATVYRVCKNAAPDVANAQGIDILRAAPALIGYYRKKAEQSANTPGKKRREEAEADRSEIKAAQMAEAVVETEIVMAALRDWQAEMIREVSALPLETEMRDKIFLIMRDAAQTAANGINLETQEPDEIQS